MFQCAECAKLFSSIMALTGHKRMHGQSNGKSKKIICSCVITRQVMPYQYLEMYQEKLVGCKQCDKLFHPTASRTTFCSRSCAATYNNKVYVKRKKQEKPTKIIKERKTYTKKEKSARNIAAVQAYRARKYSATLPDTDRKLINKIYEMCPKDYEVDHIIALSEGGPHHQDNLQYLPAMENRRKNRTQNYDKDLAIQWQDYLPY
jgi:C2H2-type zinc finger